MSDLLSCRLAPWLFQRHFPEFVEQKLERRVSVDYIGFNPFLLQLEVANLVISNSFSL
jgi:hypothetical protein